MSVRSTLVIGGGIAGLSTAWHLAKRGESDVRLLERADRVGTESSAKAAGILRTVSSDSLTGALAREGAAFLSSPPPGFADAPLIEPVGLILTGERGALNGLQRGAEVRDLSPEELSRLVPDYAGPREEAWYLEGNGRLDIARTLASFERAAANAGVRLETRSEVASLLVEDGRVSGVTLKGGAELRADRTVLAAGAWAGKLGKTAGSRVTLSPTRRHLWTSAASGRVAPDAPVLWRLGEEFYCRPENGGLLACGCEVDPIDAEDPDRCELEPRVRERIRTRLAANLPRLSDLTEARYWCGLRTLTADGRFAVGPDPDLRGLFWVAGLGGWGMSTGAAVGRLAADLILDPTSEPAFADGLAPGRLKGD